MSSLAEFLASSNLLPHGHCLFWRPDLLLLHVISDVLIAVAYFSIPLALLELLRRRKDLVFNHVFLMFAAFITACGLTHVFNVADIWLGLYPLSGIMKAFTAFISVVTAVACWKLLPAAVALPSPSQLQAEVDLRVQAEGQLREHNAELERRVVERTAELSAANEQLRNEIAQRIEEQQRAEYLAAVVKSTDDSILRTDAGGIIQYWNQGATAMYGYSEEEMLGKHITELLAEGAEQKNRLTHAEVGTTEVLRRTKDGQKIHVLLSVCEIKDAASGAVIGYASISRSIQKRKEAEQKLQLTIDNLGKANADLKDFVYIASHDLQEPLRLITSYLSIIEEDYGDKLDEDGIRYMNYTQEAATRLQQLIHDLLGYSRLHTTSNPVGPADSGSIISEAIQDLTVAIEEKSATINVANNMPTLNCDDGQLRQVFQNLISNALKYSEEATPPIINISATQNDDETCFLVEDNGIGFEQRQAERIFQVFRRLHPRHHYSGTGIGLAICKKIVDRHDGKMWAESEPDKGSRFYFSIPRDIKQDLAN